MKNNLKTTLCNELVNSGVVEENDIIKHSYTQQILNGNKKSVEKSNEMITLTTRGDCVGVCVKEEMPRVVGGVGEKKSNNGTQYYEQNRIYDGESVATAIPAESAFHPNYQVEEQMGGDSKLRIRKLTPRECVRLMGFTDSDYEAMRSIGMSDAAIYHMAGDSIVVTVLISIFSQLINENDNHKEIVKHYIEKGVIQKCI